jgi:hypothetical protein
MADEDKPEVKEGGEHINVKVKAQVRASLAHQRVETLSPWVCGSAVVRRAGRA